MSITSRFFRPMFFILPTIRATIPLPIVCPNTTVVVHAVAHPSVFFVHLDLYHRRFITLRAHFDEEWRQGLHNSIQIGPRKT